MGTYDQIWALPCALNPSMVALPRDEVSGSSSYLVLGGDGENHFVGSRPERKLLLKKQHRHAHESNYCIVGTQFYKQQLV